MDQPLGAVCQQEKQYPARPHNDGERFQAVQPDKPGRVAIPQDVQGHDPGQHDQRNDQNRGPDSPKKAVLLATASQEPGHQRVLGPARPQHEHEDDALKRQEQEPLQGLTATHQERVGSGCQHNLSGHKKQQTGDPTDSECAPQKQASIVVQAPDLLPPASCTEQVLGKQTDAEHNRRRINAADHSRNYAGVAAVRQEKRLMRPAQQSQKCRPPGSLEHQENQNREMRRFVLFL